MWFPHNSTANLGVCPQLVRGVGPSSRCCILSRFLVWKENRIVQEQTPTCLNLSLCQQTTHVAGLSQGMFQNWVDMQYPVGIGKAIVELWTSVKVHFFFVYPASLQPPAWGPVLFSIIIRASLPWKQRPEELGQTPSVHNLRTWRLSMQLHQWRRGSAVPAEFRGSEERNQQASPRTTGHFFL